MTNSQLALLIDELNNITLDLLDIDLFLMEEGHDISDKVSNITGRLLRVNIVLTEHLDRQKIES